MKYIDHAYEHIHFISTRPNEIYFEKYKPQGLWHTNAISAHNH